LKGFLIYAGLAGILKSLIIYFVIMPEKWYTPAEKKAASEKAADVIAQESYKHDPAVKKDVDDLIKRLADSGSTVAHDIADFFGLEHPRVTGGGVETSGYVKPMSSSERMRGGSI
jgi:hypothetical protein